MRMGPPNSERKDSHGQSRTDTDRSFIPCLSVSVCGSFKCIVTAEDANPAKTAFLSRCDIRVPGHAAGWRGVKRGDFGVLGSWFLVLGSGMGEAEAEGSLREEGISGGTPKTTPVTGVLSGVTGDARSKSTRRKVGFCE